MSKQTKAENIREIISLFIEGEITEKEALYRLEQARRIRHNFLERFLSGAL